MQRFTNIKLFGFERVAFAHSLTAENYRYDLESVGYGIYGQTPEKGGVLEIGFVEQNPVLLKNGEDTIRVGENCIFVLPPNSCFLVEAERPGVHRHTTAEFLIRAECTPVDRWQAPKEGEVTLPLVIPPCGGSGEVFSLIRSIAVAKTAQLERSWFAECADFVLLLSKLCALTDQTANPGKQRYCERAKTFVSCNIHRSLTVGEIAGHLGISKNYLTNVFKEGEGIPLTEYISRCKLSHMTELIRRYGYSLTEAAEHVGYQDANYVSRLFKKYYGMTVSDYRKTMEKKG
jgi:AraC-like DNA-binding protein